MSNLSLHFKYMGSALFQAYKALKANEVPVGCVFVKDNEIIATGINDTNKSLNGTRHAEFLGIEHIMKTCLSKDGTNETIDTENVKSFFNQVDLYVTVEPCVMCASALRQIGIRRVFFGCANERFGGNGSVLDTNTSIHQVDEPYNSYPGFLRTEAIQLLRMFYIQENAKAPVPKVKKNKDIDNKEFPPLMFKTFIDVSSFEKMYGTRRSFLMENKANVELTPILNRSYVLRDLVEADEGFYDSFYDIDDQGKVKFEEESDIKRKKLS